MRKTGLLWRDGKGERSPKRQRERLEADNVQPTAIDYDLPAPRDGEALCVDGVDWLPPDVPKPDASDLADWYVRNMNDGGLLRDVRGPTEYRGLMGLADLIRDWLTARRRRQTAKARSKRARKPKLTAPGFYLRLTPTGKQEVRERFESGDETIDDLARAYGTTRASLYRAAKMLGWNERK